jgi:hypothetical protein
MSKPAWYGVVAGLPQSVNEGNPEGKSIEGRYAVVNGWIFVEDPAGNRIGARQLSADENPKTAARGILRTTRADGATRARTCFIRRKARGESRRPTPAPPV